MSTHTKEPWIVVRGHTLNIATEDEEENKDGFIAIICEKPNDETRDAIADRIVSCVNALAGIENPQEALRMAREALQNMLDLQDQMGIDETPKHYDEYLESARKALAALGDQPEEGA